MQSQGKLGSGLFLFLLVLAGGGAVALAASPNPPPTGAAARSTHTSQALPAALRPVLYRALAKDAGATYNINKQGCAVLPKQKLEGCFDRAGADFTGTTALRLHLVALGRGNNLASITAAQPVIEANEASYAHGDLTEWWRVLPIGFEQGFTIAKRPSGDGYLTLALAASRQDAGAPTISHSREGGNPVKTSPSIPLRSEGGKEIAWGNLRYGQLVVTDANGKVVPATFRVAQDHEQARSRGAGERILIAVNDAHAAYPLTVDPLVWAEAQKVTASDGGRDDQFGYAVALSGTTALVGAPGHSEGGGAAYVFGEAGGSWTQTAELLAQANVGSLCGTSVALSGTRALLGCPDPGFPGGVVVFSESGGTWTRTAFLQPSDSEIQDDFGYSVAFSGTTALVGAPGHEINQGVAYVFGDSGGIWAQTAELVASDGAAGDEFGWSVALDGSTALIGAPSHDGQGTAYVFAPSGATWVQAAELAASDGAAGDQFGDSVALDGATALVGAPYSNYAQGAAYDFDESGGSWTQGTELTDGGTGTGLFGYSVALAGGTVLAGAIYPGHFTGAAYFVSKLDLGLAVSAPQAVVQGQQYTSQTIATNNASAATVAFSITVAVPAAASLIAAGASQGSCTSNATLVTCALGSVAGNAGVATVNVFLKAVGAPGDTIKNTATVLASPPLTAAAATEITASVSCPAGYTSYTGTLDPGHAASSPPYQAPAGEENGILYAGAGFELFAARWRGAAQWRFYAAGAENEIHREAPSGRYMWAVKASPNGAGGAYTLCILHP